MMLSCATSHGFVAYFNDAGAPLRWNLANPPDWVHTNIVNRQTKAVRFSIASDAYSPANRVAEINAVRACFGQWQAISGTILKFEEGGFAGPGADIDLTDHTNVVFWAKNGTFVNGGRDDIRGLRGLTVVAFSADNTLLEADIVLNGAQFQWLTDFNDTVSDQPFVEASALHEIGHFIGLDHSPVGGATVALGGLGQSAELGLSSDEVAAARFLYPRASTLVEFGNLEGRVSMNGNPVFGAIVTAETEDGNVIAGTVSSPNGFYQISMLPPGDYGIRATPMDPAGNDNFSSLIRGVDISFDHEFAETGFLPTTNRIARIDVGAPKQLDFAVMAGEPAFRISAISHPSDLIDIVTANRWAATIRRGQSNLFVGVISKTLPTNGASFSVSGDGLVLGDPIFQPNRLLDGFHAILIPISVSQAATPGLRSLIVARGSDLAIANGYLEVLPNFPDFNFDGLDDRFQRRFFPVFTDRVAAPEADPDGDGFDNAHEFRTGTDPQNPLSLKFRIESVLLTNEGTRIQWQSGAGGRYQVYTRRSFAGSSWERVGDPVVARNTMTEFIDRSAKTEIQFYRVEAVP